MKRRDFITGSVLVGSAISVSDGTAAEPGQAHVRPLVIDAHCHAARVGLFEPEDPDGAVVLRDEPDRAVDAPPAERGPVDEALVVRSLAEFEHHYGGRVSYGALHDDLNVYFGEGGQEAAIARVVGDAPVEATLTLVDRAGAPLDGLALVPDHELGSLAELPALVG